MKNIFAPIKNLLSFSKAESGQEQESVRRFFGSGDISINASNAQKISSVLSCVNIKANALAVIPIKTYIRTSTGKQENFDDTLYNILRYEPNPYLTASLYKKMISQDIDLRGNHYSQIIRNGLGQVVALYPLMADKMQVIAGSKGKRIYKYDNIEIPSSKILHVYDIPDEQGLKGISRIEYAKQTLEFASNTSKHGNKLFKNGATPSGSFEIEETLSDESYKRLKDDLESKYVGLENAGTPLLLEGGLTFKPLNITNSDAQWLESRRFNREEIASIFGVPVAMLNDANNTAYGNLEQKYLEFYSGTIFPLTTIIEEQFRQSLLSQSQKSLISIKFKYNTMLRVDTQTRANYYKTRFDIGSMSPNEIRELEDENGFVGGDEHYIQLNLATVSNINKGGTLNG